MPYRVVASVCVLAAGLAVACTVFAAAPQLRCTKATQPPGSAVITYGTRVGDDVGPSTTRQGREITECTGVRGSL